MFLLDVFNLKTCEKELHSVNVLVEFLQTMLHDMILNDIMSLFWHNKNDDLLAKKKWIPSIRKLCLLKLPMTISDFPLSLLVNIESLQIFKKQMVAFSMMGVIIQWWKKLFMFGPDIIYDDRFWIFKSNLCLSGLSSWFILFIGVYFYDWPLQWFY